MTTLTSAQKEEVAVLLGYHDNVSPIGTPMAATVDPETFFDEECTLEAMFAKCRERKWCHVLTYWAAGDFYVAEISEADDSIENIGDAEDPDPVAAFALAFLLAAHKEASNG